MSAGRPSGGKYSKRHCPALNGIISPADCGSRRGSALACPADCAFYPFGRAALDHWLKVDSAWSTKSLEYIGRHLSDAQFRDLVQSLTIPMQNSRLELECALQNAVYHALFLRKDPAGTTLVERWEAERWAGLNNDEQVMMRHRRHGRPTVIEVQRVLDPQTVECVDALAPDTPPFQILDRGVATQTVRFSRVFTWLFRYPHFCRVGANAIEIPSTTWPDWRAAIAERYQRARDPRPDLTLPDFLAESIVESAGLITSLSEAYHQQVLANLDFHHCIALYRFSAPQSEIEQVFQSRPDFALATESQTGSGPHPLATYTWLCRGESAAFDSASTASGGLRLDSSVEGVTVLGHARLFKGNVVFETLSKRKDTFMRQMIERYFGTALTLDTESVRDFATIMAERERRERALASAQGLAYGPDAAEPAQPEPAPAETADAESGTEPISHETRQQALAEQHRQHYVSFLDKSLEARDGSTPRAAAADPAQRPRLIEVMKQHIHGVEQRNRESGLDLELDWVIEELGLRELL